MYLPPIHRSGLRTGREKNIAYRRPGPRTSAARGRSAKRAGIPGSTRQLGTLEEFEQLVARAGEHGLEIALDFAIQCSPDHPWVPANIPTGSTAVRTAPGICGESAEEVSGHLHVNFDARGLEEPVGGAARRATASGSCAASRVFRVDNPHTKALGFWEWLIYGHARERAGGDLSR